MSVALNPTGDLARNRQVRVAKLTKTRATAPPGTEACTVPELSLSGESEFDGPPPDTPSPVPTRLPCWRGSLVAG